MNRNFGRYEITRELGRGGMATVYLAHDPRTGRDVALKVLPRLFLHDPTFRGRFEREARIVASLEHPAIVPVYDFGEEDEQPYMVMRYMSGGSLADRIGRGPIPVADAAHIVRRISGALAAAHARGIVHRDLKPGNILFDEAGEAYLADFGIVKLAEATASFTGSAIVGTPSYMSPEQVHGEKTLDGRSDVYTLGIILFEMLTGRTPYRADTPAKMMMAHVLEPVPRVRTANPNLPEAAETIISRAMAKDPDERYFPATGLGEAVMALAQGGGAAHKSSSPATAATGAPAAAAGRSRRTLWVAGCATLLVLVLLLGGGAGAAFWLSRPNPTPTTAAALAAQADTDTSTPIPIRTATSMPGASATPRPSTTPTIQPSATLAATPTVAEISVAAVRVILSSVNVRGGPGTNYPAIGILRLDDVVQVLATDANGDWYNVLYDDGERGWIAANVTESIDALALEQIQVAQTIPAAPQATATSTRRPTRTATPVPPAGDGGSQPDPTRTNTPRPITATPTSMPGVTATTTPTNTPVLTPPTATRTPPPTNTPAPPPGTLTPSP